MERQIPQAVEVEKAGTPAARGLKKPREPPRCGESGAKRPRRGQVRTILSPSLRVTIAFFQSGDLPA